MNPSLGPELVPVLVGRGGDEEVSVVARRVGLKRRDVGWFGEPYGYGCRAWTVCTNPLLPNKAVIAKVLKHRLLTRAEIVCRILLSPKLIAIKNGKE